MRGSTNAKSTSTLRKFRRTLGAGQNIEMRCDALGSEASGHAGSNQAGAVRPWRIGLREEPRTIRGAWVRGNLVERRLRWLPERRCPSGLERTVIRQQSHDQD